MSIKFQLMLSSSVGVVDVDDENMGAGGRVCDNIVGGGCKPRAGNDCERPCGAETAAVVKLTLSATIPAAARELA